MKLVPIEKPLLLVVDPSLVFLRILQAVLRRAACDVEIVAFQQPAQAIFWLNGEMDREKAAKHPLATQWNSCSDLRPPRLAIVNLGFPIEERERVMDWLSVHFRATKIITTSAQSSNPDDDRDELYWRQVISHLPQPVTVEAVIEHVVSALSSN